MTDRFDPQVGGLPMLGEGTIPGTLNPIPSIPFNPQADEGQVIAIGAVSVVSAAMTPGYPHWWWATKSCWLKTGNAGVVAAAGDFPFPAGAVAEWMPISTGIIDRVAVIETAESAGTVGNFYIGRSA